MTVELLYNTPLWVCSRAIRKCWASEDKSDTVETKPYLDYDITDYDERDYFIVYPECGDKDKELIERVGNKNKHKSTLEHLVYTFDIDGISRACLQELARHRMASYSVKSTRYTLKELSKGIGTIDDYLVSTGNDEIDSNNWRQLNVVAKVLQEGASNDITKYLIPEAYKTSLIMTINARSLQNFLELRSSKYALWEIRELALNIYKAIPEEHKYLFEESINVH